MSNVDNAFGLRPVRYVDGRPYNGAVQRCYTTDGTAIYVGGLVQLTGAGDSDGVPAVTGNLSTGSTTIGVVVGVDSETRDALMYKAATTNRYVFVAWDAETLVLQVQDDGTATPSAGWAGSVADLTGFTSGSTTTGRSSIEISGTTVTASGDNTADVVILGAAQLPGNDPTAVNAIWEVRLNNLQLVDGFTGV